MKLNTVLYFTLVMASQLALAETRNENSSGSNSATQTLTKSHKVGINASPIWLLVGGLGAKIEYFTSETISVGLDAVVLQKNVKGDSSSDGSSPAYKQSYKEINLGTNIMLTGSLSTNGIYINPSIGYITAEISDFDIFKLQGGVSAPQARLTAGYQWINRQNDIRLALGGGLSVVQDSDIVVKNDLGKEIARKKVSNLGGAALDFQIGYLF